MPIREFQKQDIEPLTKILTDTEMFRKDEIDVAVELMEIVIEEPEQKDYIMRTYVDKENVVRGYYCVGSTPMTEGTFDLYWIAVDPGLHRRGIGQELLGHCETTLKSMAGRLIVVETSSLPKYKPTRIFYEKQKYHETARIRNYYSAGDDLVIYTKQLKEN